MRLSRRFALVGAAAALVPLLAYGAVSISVLREGTRRSVGEGMVHITERTAEQLNGWLDRTTAQFAALASELDSNRLERWQQEHAVRNWVLRFREFRSITVFDANGQPVASSLLAPESLRPGVHRAGPYGVQFSGLTIDDDLLPSMSLTSSVEAADGSRETLVATLNLEQIWRVVDQLRVGERGYAMLVDEDGRLFAHGDPARKRVIAREMPIENHPLAQAARASRAGLLTPEEYVDAAGERRLAVAALIPTSQWLLVLEQPTSEAFALADRLQQWLLASIATALVVMIAVGSWLGRSLLRQITALRRGTAAIAAGNLQARVAFDGDLEFEQLAEAFNYMASRIGELQDAARRQERQAMWGRIVSGIVHDLSHPVKNLVNHTKHLVRRPDDEAFRLTFSRTVERETTTMKRMLDDLRQVGSPAALERFRIDLERSVRDAVETSRDTAEAAGLTIDCPTTHSAIAVEADAFALGRVWRNLLQNAIEATPNGGQIVVRIEREGSRAAVRVRDTGRGIEPERLPKLFDEFVTTKRRGLGLGLAICKRIVEQLDGSIELASDVGSGTTVTVRLTIADDASVLDVAATSAPASGAIGGVAGRVAGGATGAQSEGAHHPSVERTE